MHCFQRNLHDALSGGPLHLEHEHGIAKGIIVRRLDKYGCLVLKVDAIEAKARIPRYDVYIDRLRLSQHEVIDAHPSLANVWFVNDGEDPSLHRKSLTGPSR